MATAPLEFDADGRHIAVLQSYRNPGPDSKITWAYEPCARQHIKGQVCILENGHWYDDAIVPELMNMMSEYGRMVDMWPNAEIFQLAAKARVPFDHVHYLALRLEADHVAGLMRDRS